MDNLNEQNAKNLDGFQSLDEKNVKYEFSLPTLDMKSSKKIVIIPPQASSDKFECHFENCKKVYSSHETLLYHMKTKHKKGDAKKQMYQPEEITLTQRERRKTRRGSADSKIITLKSNMKTSEKSHKTRNEKTIQIKEEQFYYSNTKHNKKTNQNTNNQNSNQKKDQKVIEPLSKDDRLLGKKLRSSVNTICLSKNIFDKELQPNIRKKNYFIKNNKTSQRDDSSNNFQEKICDTFYENISTEDTSKNHFIKKMSPAKSKEMDQSDLDLKNNSEKILEDYNLNNENHDLLLIPNSSILIGSSNSIKLNNHMDIKNNSYLFDLNIENEDIINQDDVNLCFRPERKNSERNFMSLLNDNLGENLDENMMGMDTYLVGLDDIEEERSESFNNLPNIEKNNFQILDSSSVDLDVLLSNNEQKRKFSSGSLIGTF